MAITAGPSTAGASSSSGSSGSLPGRSAARRRETASTGRPGRDPELPEDELAPAVEGPAVIAMDGATCWVAGGWTARSDPIGGLVLERGP